MDAGPQGATQEGAAGLGPRRLAWAVVVEVLRSRAALDDVFARLAAQAALPPRDEALARAIAVVLFRRFGTLRRALLERLARGWPGDERFAALLAIGAAQILFLDVPDHAAVDTAVRLAAGDKRLKPFVSLANAVLRRIARERRSILDGSDALGDDTPDWLARRWTERFGAAGARAIAEAHRRGAALDLTVRGDPHAWAERLGGVVLPTGSVRLPAGGIPVRELPGYGDGAWWVQDAAAALPARLVAPRPGERIADLCAAPGGKTAQLASAGARVLAVDRSARRLRTPRGKHGPARAVRGDDGGRRAGAPGRIRVRRRSPRCALHRNRHDPAPPGRGSGRSGTRTSDNSPISSAACWTRRRRSCAPAGGSSIAPARSNRRRGADQAEAFRARHPHFACVPVEPGEIGGLADLVTGTGDLRTLPCHSPVAREGRGGGLDGFFAVRWRRHEA